MTLGEHIGTLRKRSKLSQSGLGEAVGTSGDIIGRYERDEMKPSIEVAVKIASVLEVSLDFLVGNTILELDKNTLRRLQDIEKLPVEQRKQVFMVIDALIRDFKAKKMYAH